MSQRSRLARPARAPTSRQGARRLIAPALGRPADSLPFPFADPVFRRPIADRLVALVVCSGLVALALVIGVAIQRWIHIESILLVYVPVILFAAVRYGFWTAAWAAVLSVWGTSFLLGEPRFSIEVSDAASAWAFAIFLIAAGITSSLAGHVRQRAHAVRHHSRVVEQLYAFSSRLAGISTRGELSREVVQQVASIVQADVALLLRKGQALTVVAVHPPETELSADDVLAADWRRRGRTPPGETAPSRPASPWRYWPLITAKGPAGALGVRRRRDAALDADESRLIDALVEQTAVNLERIQLAEDMRATEVLAETEKLRTALLTSISHDLKTPLASILGNVSSLRKYGHLYDAETRDEMLEFAENETLRLSRFVDNVLHMTRIGAGSLQPTIEMIDLSDVIGSALKRLAKSLEQHEIVMDLPDELPMVPADFVLMEHVLSNLLDNAAKYSPKGSRIELRVSVRGGFVAIDVVDEGPGVDQKDMERIFERFYRVKTGDHRPAGVGLGLAICKGFVEAMGGRIGVVNRTDRSGAIFTVELPLAQGLEEPQ
ncbi:MAG TPA: ATP-binding protein [Gammaproteobacteria bacterium]|nr:ATP-binding protein [Gammaproteobacteria bacterium]